MKIKPWRILLSLVATAVLPIVYADTNSSGTNNNLPAVNSLPGWFEINYLPVKMPNGQNNLGLAGLHYALNLLPIPNFYTGMGIYGAVSGNQGGFFVLGMDNDYRAPINDYVNFDSGLFAGGGGAHSNNGSGLLLVPHIGLDIELNDPGPWVSLSYSYAEFVNSDIPGGNTYMLSMLWPIDFNFLSGQPTGAEYALSGGTGTYFFAPLYRIYNTPSGVNNSLGAAQGNLGLLGFEGGEYLNDNLYLVAGGDGAAKGNANGYMDMLGGLGYDMPISATWHFLNQVMVGAGGGGNVQTGNGILAEADTGFAWDMTEYLEPRVMVGYLTATNNDFHALTMSFALVYRLNYLDMDSQPSLMAGNQLFVNQNYRVEFFNQTLFNPARKDDSLNGDSQSFGVQASQYFSPNWYVNYQTAFAYAGTHTGGMAQGALGLGTQYNYRYLHPHADILLGAIGGGSISAGDGLYYEPEIGLLSDFNKNWSLDTSYGRMKSFNGSLNSNVLNLGISYQFGQLIALKSS